MSTPKLNIHPKSLFLIHRGDKIFNLPRDKKIPASGFFKCLVISRQFLRASQIYRVYQFAIFNFCDNNKFDVRFTSGKAVGAWTKHFQLTLEEIQRLNELLNVEYVDVFRYEYKYADKHSAVCKIFKGHIALVLSCDENENEIHHHEIINQVQHQLYSLRCGAKSLINSSDIPHLNLIYCALTKFDNFYQLKQVLTNHQIRKIATRNDYKDSPRFDEQINDEYFDDFPVCPGLKKLDFEWNQLDETHELLPKITKMIPFFPNLMRILCYFEAERYTSEQFSLQKLIGWIRKECRKIEQLQKACLPTTAIGLHYLFRIRKSESFNTVKQIVKQILKETKFKQLDCFKRITNETKDENVVIIRQYYNVKVVQKEPKFCSSVRFTVDLDPLTLNDVEVIEDDDKLLIPKFAHYVDG